MHFPKPHSLLLSLPLLLLTLTACVPVTSGPVVPPPAVGSCSLPLLAPATDEQAITAVLTAEGEWVVQQDIAGLMRLWDPAGQIIDANHTPPNPTDDQRWQGADAIRNRYVHRVFPGAPSLAQPTALVISVQGNRATITSTTRIGQEISPGGDRWRLVKKDGCWLLQELVFNLERP